MRGKGSRLNGGGKRPLKQGVASMGRGPPAQAAKDLRKRGASIRSVEDENGKHDQDADEKDDGRQLRSGPALPKDLGHLLAGGLEPAQGGVHLTV